MERDLAYSFRNITEEFIIQFILIISRIKPFKEEVRWILDVGSRPDSRDPFLSGKGPKTIDAPFALPRLGGRKSIEGGPTRMAQTRPAS